MNAFESGLDFPNLPYYMEGDLKLTQSNAILRHLARKHDLMGQTSAERARSVKGELDYENGTLTARSLIRFGREGALGNLIND